MHQIMWMIQLIAVCIAFVSLVAAQAPKALPFSFGPASGDSFTGPNDDETSSRLPLSIPMTYLGNRMASVSQGTDGFLEVLQTGNIVGGAVFVYGMDIDTRNGGVGQNELWLRTGSRANDLLLARDIIAGTGTAFTPQATVVATWVKVEAFERRTGLQNTFQLTMAYSASGTTWAIFAYRQLQFFQADSSRFALVNYLDGNGVEERLIAFVNNTGIMNQLLIGTNCNRPGVFAFPINEAPPSNSPTTTPSHVPSAAPSPKDCAITWNLFNSTSNAFVAELTNGVSIENLPLYVNIEAFVPCDAPINEVIIELWGGPQRIRRHKELQFPYFLFGNNGADVLNGSITAGIYGIRAIVNGVVSPFTMFSVGRF